MSSGRKRPGTQTERGEPETEAMEEDAVQPEVDPQPLKLPARNSKNVRPRARPLKRAKSQTHITSDFSPQPQSTDRIQLTASEAVVVGGVESDNASPPTQVVENEGSHEDTPRLPQERPNLKLHQLNHANKRQKISDQVQSEIAETMNRPVGVDVDVDATAKGNYTLMAFQRLAIHAC